MTTAEKLVAILKAAGLTCATAESCTGGGIGSAITSVAGSSEVFEGGVISYSNSVKVRVLGVREETLRDFGAVSSEVAGQMAQGARQVTGADLAVAVTGVAGPGGGSAEKPVGTVWFGLATAVGVRTEKKLFIGDREAVRTQTITHALGILSVAALQGACRVTGENPHGGK